MNRSTLLAWLKWPRREPEPPAQEDLRDELLATVDAINRSCMFCPGKTDVSQIVVYEPQGGEAAYLCYEHLGKFLGDWTDPRKREWHLVRVD